MKSVSKLARSRTITQSTRQALLACCCSAAFISMPALAQDEASPEEDEVAVLQKVVTTGSLVRRSTFQGKSPLQVVDRSQFTAEGAGNVTDIAKNLTVNTNSLFQNETGDLIGTSQFNIRGLGVGSTLTLINGRRGGKSATTDTDGNQFFDINQLPLSMIQRVDVQTDGASATYGSDAVGGVVNVITRKGFEGLELTGRYENASNSAYSLDFASGLANERGSINLYARYYSQDNNLRSDFDWLNERIGGNGDITQSRFISSTGAPGSYRPATIDAATGVITEGGTSTRVADPNCEAAGGILTGTICRHNFIDQVDIIPEEHRFQAFSEIEFNVNDKLTAFSEMSFSNNRIIRTQGPFTFGNGLVSNGRTFIPGDHPFNFFVDDGAGGLDYIDPSTWDNSVHTAVPLSGQLRPLGDELNARRNGAENLEYIIQYTRGVVGFEYELPNNWAATTSYVYSRADWQKNAPYGIAADAYAQSILDGAFNPFGTRISDPTLVSPKDGSSLAGTGQDAIDQFIYTERDRAESTQQVAEIIISGDAFSIPAGTVGIAFGAQFREESFEYEADPIRAAGEGRRSSTEPFLQSGDQDVWALFGEAVIPILPNFEIQAALRHESYGGSVGETTDPKIAARWDLTDSLSLRGSYGTSFQAPSARQTSSSVGSTIIDSSVAFNATSGALECGASSEQNNVIVGTSGSDSLKPTDSKNINAGLIFQPSSGWRFGADYWNFEYTDLITADGSAQSIIDSDCSDGIPNDPRITYNPDGTVRRVDLSFINTGMVETDGFDLSADYGTDLATIGDINIGLKVSYVQTFDIQTETGGPVVDGAGNRNFTNQFGPVPKWRANLSAGWSKGNHTANVVARYIHSYANDQLSDGSDVDSFVTADLQYGYAFDTEGLLQDAGVILGVRNVLDEDPPSVGDSDPAGRGTRPGYEASIHDVRGRTVYFELRKAF